MIDRLYIDGNDAYTRYGAYVLSSGYDDVVAYPPLKKINSNDWHEENGIEADLSAPVLDSKEISLQLKIANKDKYALLIDDLSTTAYHTFYFKEIGRTYTLRLVSVDDVNNSPLFTATLILADDYPLNGYTYTAPVSTVTPCNDYKIDSVPLTAYGCRVLTGTLDEIMRTPSVKQNLLRNIPSEKGVIYDNSAVTYQSKEVQINCLMRAETLTELWKNYDALLYDLTRSGERELYCSHTAKTYKCYYSSADNTRFAPKGKIWLEFTLKMIFTRK